MNPHPTEAPPRHQPHPLTLLLLFSDGLLPLGTLIVGGDEEVVALVGTRGEFVLANQNMGRGRGRDVTATHLATASAVHPQRDGGGAE